MTAVTEPTKPIRTRGVPQPGRAGRPAAQEPRRSLRKIQLGGSDPSIARATELLSQIDEHREPEPQPELPDPTALVCRVARAAIEVLRGERPASQLARWTTAQVYDQLVARERLLSGTRAGRPRPVAPRVGVRRVRLVRLGTASAEATVVLHDGERVRAAAVRLEGRRGTWKVTCLELG
ncbi:Rv3235 family protein [Myceligenerans pegani]|uniref:Energy transducer TonB n=1 Tax=Myceligenerans pegani TaxID=2776917 RepID=A0ABR9N1Z8_9MICO|nr:Rv3235 family protein [Myceligenerans sp. TRM 65318]MBE1877375.1 energy transducer TonB [Myceligenerans sp. TRM 65318]MBE3019646.1 energy transducer TonB [Myceligenerans sp. TRM 65318]